MNRDLPGILDRYFKAQNAHDIDAMVACFAPDAVVRDEGHDIVGTDAIRAWKNRDQREVPHHRRAARKPQRG